MENGNNSSISGQEKKFREAIKRSERKQRSEQIFLEGPSNRRYELAFVWDVAKEFVRGFRALHFVGPCVTVFGSARFGPGHEAYELAVEAGKMVAELGFTTMTGGGPGIMEAANKGAKEAGGKSVGCNIVLPREQHPNPYLDKWVNIDFFFVRKVILTKYSYAFVVLPGGFGTIDEFFEALTLIQTKMITRFPVVLMGKKYHKHLYGHVQNLVQEGSISKEDIHLFLFTDSIEEAKEHLRKYAVEQFGLTAKKAPKPISWIGE